MNYSLEWHLTCIKWIIHYTQKRIAFILNSSGKEGTFVEIYIYPQNMAKVIDHTEQVWNSLFVAVPKSVAYVASKHAVLGLSESLRNDLPDYIHVGTIFPGYVDTPLTGEVEGGMNADEFANIVKEQIKNEEHIIVSHAYNSVHIEKRNNEITSAYKKYAPRYDGDDIYDIKTILKNFKNK